MDDLMYYSVLGKENVGGKIIDFDIASKVMMYFRNEHRYPAKVFIMQSENDNTLFKVYCSARARKPNNLPNFVLPYAPFKIIQKTAEFKKELYLITKSIEEFNKL